MLGAHRIAPAVAADDRARACQRRLGILRHVAVVDRNYVESMIGRTQQREAAAHAEPDHPSLPGAIGPCRQELPRAVQCVERRPATGTHLLDRAADAPYPELAVPQVRSHCQVAPGREFFCLAANIVVQAERFVDDNDTRPRPGRRGRYGQVAAPGLVTGRIADVWHAHTLSYFAALSYFVALSYLPASCLAAHGEHVGDYLMARAA